MTESLLYTTGKKAPRVFLILLVIANMALVSVPYARASSTTLSVEPPDYTAPTLGHTFTVNVTVTNVLNLSNFEFKVGYNTTLLDAVSCSLTPIIDEYFTLLLPSPWSPTYGINDAAGFVYFGAGTLLDKNNPFNGSGALLTINFTATAVGNGTLHLYYTSMEGVGPPPDWTPLPIDPECVDGSITVIPEFPPSIVTPLLLIITLAAAFLGKMVWSKKRKDISSLE